MLQGSKLMTYMNNRSPAPQQQQQQQQDLSKTLQSLQLDGAASKSTATSATKKTSQLSSGVQEFYPASFVANGGRYPSGGGASSSSAGTETLITIGSIVRAVF